MELGQESFLDDLLLKFTACIPCFGLAFPSLGTVTTGTPSHDALGDGFNALGQFLGRKPRSPARQLMPAGLNPP